jgi:hypothetical protein
MTVVGRGGPLRAIRTSAALETLIPVALVIAFGVGWLFVRPDFFWQDDFQTQYLPASREIARALYAGELPILSNQCWFGAALAGEYQHGVFSISTLLLTSVVWKLGLTLANTAAALMLSHLSILAAGAFRLARSRALGLQEATLVALIASLNGWILGWGPAWYPLVTSFAWVPWLWWALERALSGPSAALPTVLAGVFLYLILAAGWPLTTLMVAVLTVCLVVRAWLVTRKPLAPWPAFAAWMIAFGLAAPALLVFLDYGSVTQRAAQETLSLDRQWMVPLSGLAGMILPAFHAWWRSYHSTWSPRACVELAGGMVPLCAAAYVVGVRGIRPLRSFDALIALLSCSFAALPCIRPFQTSFRWLPLLHLALALVGASALQTLKAMPEEKRRVHVRLALIAAGAVAFIALLSVGAELDPTTLTVDLAKRLLWMLLIWAALERLLPRLLAGWGPVALSLASLVATYHALLPVPEPPRWILDESMRENAPYEPARRYLALFDFGDMRILRQPPDERAYFEGGAAKLRVGYTAMYADLQFVNGYSAMRPAGPAAILDFNIHGEVNRWRSAQILHSETGEGGLLDLMATDGLVLAEPMRGEIPGLEQRGWREVATVEGGVVLHRERGPSPRARSLSTLEWVPEQAELILRLRRAYLSPAPLYRLGDSRDIETFAAAKLGPVKEERLRTRVQVSVPAGGQEALIVFARPWLPGWRAKLNGRRLKVFAIDELMPAVRVPAAERGELVLEYRPRSLYRGFWSMGITLLVALGWLFWDRRRRAIAARSGRPRADRTPPLDEPALPTG